MPNCGSWNGKWSGEKNRYLIFKKLKNDVYEKFMGVCGDEKSWSYDFGDGWRANVSCTLIDSKEKTKLKKVAKGNFAGYDWMIDSIIKEDEIKYCERD